MDIVTKEKRSQMMSKIRNKNTIPEKIVRSLLHKLGYRFRLHIKNLPGNPDIVLPKFNIVIFVHGCFWHQHERCKYATHPKSRIDFWKKKFDENIKRDKRNNLKLESLGWEILTIWECETRQTDLLKRRIKNTLEN